MSIAGYVVVVRIVVAGVDGRQDRVVTVRAQDE